MAEGGGHLVPICAAAIITSTILKRRQKRRERSIWVHPWIQKSTELGAYNNLIQELRLQDLGGYRKSHAGILTRDWFFHQSLMFFDQIGHVQFSSNTIKHV